MQGYLKKKSPKSPKTHGHTVVDIWQKRYFVLSDHQLKYYKTEKDAASSSAEPLKMIALVNVQCAAPNPKHTDMFLIDLGADRKVKLQAASEADRDAWVAALEQSKVEAWSKQDAQEKAGSPAQAVPSQPTAASSTPETPAAPRAEAQPATPSTGTEQEGVRSDLLAGGASKPQCCIIA